MREPFTAKFRPGQVCTIHAPDEDFHGERVTILDIQLEHEMYTLATTPTDEGDDGLAELPEEMLRLAEDQSNGPELTPEGESYLGRLNVMTGRKKTRH